MRTLRNWISDQKLHRDKSMVYVHILAHGTSSGFIKSTDGNGIHINDLIGTLTDIPTLNGKPKLVFITTVKECEYSS